MHNPKIIPIPNALKLINNLIKLYNPTKNEPKEFILEIRKELEKYYN